MAYLRVSTRREHARTERTALGRALIQAQITARQRALMLWAHAGLLGALEASIERGALGSFEPIWEPQMEKQSALWRDLEELAEELRPLPAEVVAGVERGIWAVEHDAGDPARLVGWLYVFEGSTLGAEVLAERLSQRDKRGLRYFRVYGPATRVCWKAFGARVERWVPEASAERVRVGAERAFAAIRDAFEAIHEATAIEAGATEGAAAAAPQ